MCSFEGVDAGGRAGGGEAILSRQSGSEAGEGKRSGKASKASGAEARQEPKRKRSRRASTTEDFRW